MKKPVNNSDVFKRTSVSDIGEFAEFLYREVLLLCESNEILKLKGASLTTKQFKEGYLNWEKIEYSDTKKKMIGGFLK